MDAVAKPMTAADVPSVLALVEQYWSFEGITGFDSTRIAAELTRLCAESQLGCGWITYVDGTPAGYLIAVYVFSLEHLGLTAEIDEFFVRPELRGRGIGSVLLRATEASAVRIGCRSVLLQLARGNDAARAYYRRQGYKERAGYELLDKPLTKTT